MTKLQQVNKIVIKMLNGGAGGGGGGERDEGGVFFGCNYD
jgi:hypothetical protein